VKTSNVFKILVCILLGAFIVLWGRYAMSIPDLMRQYRAQSFHKTEGQVLSTGIVSQRTSKGEVLYHPVFLYKYEIGGVSYKGQRYHYIDYSLDSNSANQIVTSHPTGSKVEVYYNPANPADAVLLPLVDVQDIAHLLLGMPFLYLASFFMFKFGRRINWTGKAKLIAGGVEIIAKGTTTHVRLPNFQPSSLALSTICILSVIASVVIAFTCASVPVPAGLLALFITIGTGAVVYFRHHQKLASGIQDLVIDENARTLELPLTFKRRQRQPFPFSEIKGVGLEQVAGTSIVAPTLLLQNGSRERLTTYLDRDNAQSFVIWLWEKLGKPTPDSGIGKDSQTRTNR
jgi:hypothetical protein